MRRGGAIATGARIARGGERGAAPIARLGFGFVDFTGGEGAISRDESSRFGCAAEGVSERVEESVGADDIESADASAIARFERDDGGDRPILAVERSPGVFSRRRRIEAIMAKHASIGEESDRRSEAQVVVQIAVEPREDRFSRFERGVFGIDAS